MIIDDPRQRSRPCCSPPAGLARGSCCAATRLGQNRFVAAIRLMHPRQHSAVTKAPEVPTRIYMACEHTPSICFYQMSCSSTAALVSPTALTPGYSTTTVRALALHHLTRTLMAHTMFLEGCRISLLQQGPEALRLSATTCRRANADYSLRASTRCTRTDAKCTVLRASDWTDDYPKENI